MKTTINFQKLLRTMENGCGWYRNRITTSWSVVTEIQDLGAAFLGLFFKFKTSRLVFILYFLYAFPIRNYTHQDILCASTQSSYISGPEINKDYFMVGECVRFLFTINEGSLILHNS